MYVIIWLLMPLQLFAQGINNLWCMGYANQFGPPTGGFDMDFITGTLAITSISRQINYGDVSATICNNSGQMLFSTNAVYVANSSGDTLMNGSGLSPSYYTNQVGWSGLFLPQTVIIIPKPGSNTNYYLIHGTVDDSVAFAHYIYYSEIDMSLDSGLGVMISKNSILLNDTLVPGRITAVKHGNGRDWWVVFHQAKTSLYYVYLINSNGISFFDSTSIGEVRTHPNGQSCFSPDGNRFAMYDPLNDLDIMNFDRCTGQFSNNIHVAINDSAAGGGVAFSSNSNVLYIASTKYVYQFDLTSSNIPNSKLTVAVWDTNYSPSPPAATTFYLAHLAPDNKLYMSCPNSTTDIHVINNPDSIGISCDVCQHCVHLPRYNSFTMPNHPNYFLGAEIGSICDSLVDIEQIFSATESINLFPNPARNILYLTQSISDQISLIRVFNSIGQEQSVIYSSIKNGEYLEMNITSLPTGIYFLEIYTEKQKFVKRFVRAE